MQEENLERRFRLAALRSETRRTDDLRATREISNETLQKLLHDLDLLEALLIEEKSVSRKRRNQARGNLKKVQSFAPLTG